MSSYSVISMKLNTMCGTKEKKKCKIYKMFKKYE